MSRESSGFDPARSFDPTIPYRRPHSLPPAAWHRAREMESHSAVGARIRAIRRRRGLTQAELAARCVLSASTLAAPETGRLMPGFDHLRRLA